VVLEVVVEGGGNLNHRQAVAQALMIPVEMLASKTKEELLDEVRCWNVFECLRAC
jgi:hypothetical protein